MRSREGPSPGASSPFSRILEVALDWREEKRQGRPLTSLDLAGEWGVGVIHRRFHRPHSLGRYTLSLESAPGLENSHWLLPPTWAGVGRDSCSAFGSGSSSGSASATCTSPSPGAGMGYKLLKEPPSLCVPKQTWRDLFTTLSHQSASGPRGDLALSPKAKSGSREEEKGGHDGWEGVVKNRL